MSERPKRDPAIKTNVLPDGHAVLVSLSTNWAQTLTPLGALVWEFCDGSNSLDDIAQQICAITNGDNDAKLKQSIKELVDELDDAGFFLQD
jgi:hypothetical protein